MDYSDGDDCKDEDARAADAAYIYDSYLAAIASLCQKGKPISASLRGQNCKLLFYAQAGPHRRCHSQCEAYFSPDVPPASLFTLRTQPSL